MDSSDYLLFADHGYGPGSDIEACIDRYEVLSYSTVLKHVRDPAKTFPDHESGEKVWVNHGRAVGKTIFSTIVSTF